MKPQMDNISYKIKDERNFRGVGKIQYIKTRILNDNWKTTYNQQKIQLTLQFTQKSALMQIQVKLLNTYSFLIELFDKNKNKIFQHEEILQGKSTTTKINMIQCLQLVSANLTLYNNPIQPKNMGIYFIVFQGAVQGAPQKQKNNNKKDMKQFTTSAIQKYSSTKEEKQFFAGRKKTSKQNLTNFDQYYAVIDPQSGKRDRSSNKKENSQKKKPSKKIKKNHDDESNQQIIPQKSNRKDKKTIDEKNKSDLDLAIALSKSQHQGKFIDLQDQMIPKALNEYGQIMKMNESNPEKQYLDQFQYEHYQNFKSYKTIEYGEQNLQKLQNVNQRWLQLQKAAEQEIKVQQRHKLSRLVHVKHLHNVQIFITGFSSQSFQELKIICEELGGKIIQNVKNSCFVITTKTAGEKLHKKHRQLKDVKYLKEDYVHDCIKLNSKLKPSDYYLKL